MAKCLLGFIKLTGIYFLIQLTHASQQIIQGVVFLYNMGCCL